MEFIQTPLQGVLLIKPRVFEDPRGYFYESFNSNAFEQAGIKEKFVQDNQSLSQTGVLRGLHFQKDPFAQGKLVRVIQGAVYDVAVDIRKNSTTYGQWFGAELSGDNKMMMYIPVGFAHGFATLKDNTIFTYKVTNFYSKESEDCLLWNDPALKIDWPIQNPLLSPKDIEGKLLKDLNSPF